jgi:hypothetical protein
VRLGGERDGAAIRIGGKRSASTRLIPRAHGLCETIPRRRPLYPVRRKRNLEQALSCPRSPRADNLGEGALNERLLETAGTAQTARISDQSVRAAPEEGAPSRPRHSSRSGRRSNLEVRASHRRIHQARAAVRGSRDGRAERCTRCRSPRPARQYGSSRHVSCTRHGRVPNIEVPAGEWPSMTAGTEPGARQVKSEVQRTGRLCTLRPRACLVYPVWSHIQHRSPSQ